MEQDIELNFGVNTRAKGFVRVKKIPKTFIYSHEQLDMFLQDNRTEQLIIDDFQKWIDDKEARLAELNAIDCSPPY